MEIRKHVCPVCDGEFYVAAGDGNPPKYCPFCGEAFDDQVRETGRETYKLLTM